MFSSRRLIPSLFLSVLLTSCGAGFVAIFSNGGSGSSPPPPITTRPPPTLATIHGNTAPLAPQPVAMLWQASVANYELPLSISRVRVELRAFGNVVDKQRTVRISDSSTVEFLYEISAINARAKSLYGDALTTHDVPATLAVFVDEKEIAKPIAITLLRSPTVEIENRPAHKVLSPHGQVLNTRITSISLRTPTNPDPGSAKYTTELIEQNGLVATVGFGNLSQTPRTAQITSAVLEPSGDLRLSISMPEVGGPIQGHLIVDSIPSGRSSLVSNLFYRPDIQGASPSTGASEGGTAVVLFGKALIPESQSIPGQLDFAAITLTVRKGGRETVIAQNRIRQDRSTGNSIIFAMPPSPDGRPGPADIRLVVDVPAIIVPNVTVEVESQNVFTYGDTQPYFGPRGAQLRAKPVRVRFSPFVDTKVAAVDAVALTAAPGGVPYASVLRTRGNGLFTRFGQAVRVAVTNDPLQRNPVDICIADFVGGGTRSGLIINSGSGQFARHSFVIGSATSNPPITFNENLELAIEESARACAAGDFNGDGVDDLVIVGTPQPSTTSSIPLLFLSDGQRTPRFTRTVFSTYDGPFDFEAVGVADVDDDDDLDLIFAQGGAVPRLLIAFGSGSGQFQKADVVDLVGRTLDLSSAGYTPVAGSRVVGVHAVGTTIRPTIVLVLSGVAKSTTSPPVVVHVRRGSGARTFAALKSSDILSFPGGNRVFVASAAGDLTNDGAAELAVVAEDDEAEPIRIFSRSTTSLLELVKNAVASGPEPLQGVRGVRMGVATAPGKHHQTKGRQALFVTHDQTLAGSIENRVSTFLSNHSSTALKLLSPQASRQIATPILGVTLGEFFSKKTKASGTDADAWGAIRDGLISLRNDGLGELTKDKSTVPATGILTRTLTTVIEGERNDPINRRSLPAFLTVDGRLGVVLPTSSSPVVYAGGSTPVDLRTFAPADPDPKKNLRVRDVQANSRVESADVDADGISDLVVLLGLATGENQGLEGESILLLFPGKKTVQPNEFPYDLPNAKHSVSSLTHGNVSSITVADFVVSSVSSSLELAVTLPLGGTLGNEIRFYRWDVTNERFAPSFVSKRHHALPIGDEPSRIVSGDYNRDGKIDIAVASRKDDRVWVFYNFNTPSSGRDVDLTKFQAAPANPLALPPGDPRQMITADVNGDASPDVVLVIESGTIVKQQQVVYYLSPGSLGGSGMHVIPHERTGNFVWSRGSWTPRDGVVSLGLGDLNGDGAPDLVLGWDTAGVGDYNLRVLFGNNF